MQYQNTLQFANHQDDIDPLRSYRQQFIIPSNGIYLCGHSLGLQHCNTNQYINEELQKWSQLGVEGHFSEHKPWLDYHTLLTPHLAQLTGALPSEVVATNSLTTNIHLMMVSFYKPTATKFKIAIEKNAFPSDRYAVLSQLKLHGYGSDCLIEMEPSANDYMTNQDINDFFETHGKSLALALIGGVNYLSGQFYDIEYISAKCKVNAIKLGVDLAHAIGNVPLQLHNWKVDFAAWCSYKYLNGGPGAVGGLFVHLQHHNKDIHRLEGWWGNKVENRFMMNNEFDPYTTAEAWQLSNAPILSMAALLPSLETFTEIGMDAIRQKSIHLTGYLEYLLHTIFGDRYLQITTSNPRDRGAQLSFSIKGASKLIVQQLADNHTYCDWRESSHGGLIRVAPIALYNSYKDVYLFVNQLNNLIKTN